MTSCVIWPNKTKTPTYRYTRCLRKLSLGHRPVRFFLVGQHRIRLVATSMLVRTHSVLSNARRCGTLNKRKNKDYFLKQGIDFRGLCWISKEFTSMGKCSSSKFSNAVNFCILWLQYFRIEYILYIYQF